MTKSDESTMYTTKILFIIVLAILVSYLLFMGKTKTSPLSPTTSMETIQSPSDLDAASDQLEAVNVDSVDTGVTQLNTEVSTY